MRGSNGDGKAGSKGQGGGKVAATTTVRARETGRDEGNGVTTTRYCGNGGGKFDSDSGGKSKGSTATTTGYRGNGGDGNKDNSKGNSGKNGERGGNNRGSASHLSLIFFFWLGSGHGQEVCFFA